MASPSMDGLRRARVVTTPRYKLCQESLARFYLFDFFGSGECKPKLEHQPTEGAANKLENACRQDIVVSLLPSSRPAKRALIPGWPRTRIEIIGKRADVRYGAGWAHGRHAER